MNVLLITFGSRGDVQPFAALARGLSNAGHEVVLAAPKHSASLVAPFVTRSFLFDLDKTILGDDPDFREGFETNWEGLPGAMLAIRLTCRIVWGLPRSLKNRSEVLDKAAMSERPKADVVVYNGFLESEIKKRFTVPTVHVLLHPPQAGITAPSDLCGNPFGMPPSVIWVARIRKFGALLVERLISRLKRSVELRNRGLHSRTSDVMDRSVDNRCDIHQNPQLLVYSKRILGPETPASDCVAVTGYWPLPADPDWIPSYELARFLSHGDSPICVVFGSSVGTESNRMWRTVVKAIRLASVRAILVAGKEAGIETDGYEEEMLVIKEAPFSWLFPQMAAVVHHGGPGTTADAIMGGRPQVVCPIFAPHYFEAHRMHEEGVAPAPLPYREITAEKLAAAISRAVTDSALARRADKLGREVRAEDGVSTAVSMLEWICN